MNNKAALESEQQELQDNSLVEHLLLQKLANKSNAHIVAESRCGKVMYSSTGVHEPKRHVTMRF